MLDQYTATSGCETYWSHNFDAHLFSGRNYQCRYMLVLAFWCCMFGYSRLNAFCPFLYKCGGKSDWSTHVQGGLLLAAMTSPYFWSLVGWLHGLPVLRSTTTVLWVCGLFVQIRFCCRRCRLIKVQSNLFWVVRTWCVPA